MSSGMLPTWWLQFACTLVEDDPSEVEPLPAKCRGITNHIQEKKEQLLEIEGKKGKRKKKQIQHNKKKVQNKQKKKEVQKKEVQDKQQNKKEVQDKKNKKEVQDKKNKKEVQDMKKKKEVQDMKNKEVQDKKNKKVKVKKEKKPLIMDPPSHLFSSVPPGEEKDPRPTTSQG